MKVVFKKIDLQNALQNARSVINGRISLPALSTVLIHAENKSILIHASCLDMSLTQKVKGDVVKDGAICLHRTKLADIVSRIDDEAVEIVVEKGKATIKGGKTRATLAGINPDEFPKMPNGITTDPIKVESADLARVISAMSDDPTRFVLNGVLFHHTEGKLGMVATDGRRLHSIAGSECRQFEDMILPSASIVAILQLFKESFSIRIESSGTVSAESLGIRFFTRIVDGRFPNWKAIIPKKSGKTLKVKTTDLIEALETCQVFQSVGNANGKSFRFCLVKVSAVAGACELASGETEEGKISRTIEATGEMKFEVDSGYLVEVLKQLSSKDAEIDMESPRTPMLIKDGNFQGVVMPIVN